MLEAGPIRHPIGDKPNGSRSSSSDGGLCSRWGLAKAEKYRNKDLQGAVLGNSIRSNTKT